MEEILKDIENRIKYLEENYGIINVLFEISYLESIRNKIIIFLKGVNNG